MIFLLSKKCIKQYVLATFINTLIISLAIIVHYEMPARISAMLPDMRVAPRMKVVVGVLGDLMAHIIEVWIFAIGYYFLIEFNKFGHLTGRITLSLIDYAYYSFSTYTSLGQGDVIPTGHIRFLSGLEALTGLVLIAWTASFMFVEMQKYWKQ